LISSAPELCTLQAGATSQCQSAPFPDAIYNCVTKITFLYRIIVTVRQQSANRFSALRSL